MKPLVVRLVLVGLVILSALADIITFLVAHDFVAFEINPLYVLTKSVWFILLLKVFVIAGFCFFLYKGAPYDWMSYMLVISSVYAIIFQFFGAYGNIQTMLAQPDVSTALSDGAAVKTYVTLAFWFELVPLLIATGAFMLHKWGGYNEGGL